MPQPTTRKTATRGTTPRVGTTQHSVPQPAAEASRDMVVSEPRRNPAGRSGRPSGPNGLKHEGTREAKRVSRADASEEARPTSRTRAGAAGRKRMASEPTSSASGTAATRRAPRKDSAGAPASPEAVAGTRKSTGGARGAAAATARVTGLRPEGARGGHTRTPSRRDTPRSR